MAAARPTITGGLGVDVDGHSFTRTILADGEKSEIDRNLTNPYLDLRARGYLVSESFGDYTVSGRLSSAYYRSSGTDGDDSGSINPSLSGYAARVSLFRDRSYPLGLFMSRSDLPSLRYEVTNRAESELQSPALAVVRRYDSVLEQRGLTWNSTLPREGNLSIEVRRNENTVDRRYDFGEDRDIYVDFTTIRPDTLEALHRVLVRNQIPDETVLLFINLAFVDTLVAGESVPLLLETGPQRTEFVPLTRNPFSATVDVNGDMQWTVVFNPPPGAKDVAQVTDSARGVFNIGGDGAFEDEALFEYSDNRDDVQRMNSRLTTFNNAARYEISPTTKIDFLTIYTQNNTNVVDVSSQSSESILQQSTARWHRRRGPQAQLSHSYGRMSTKTDVTDVVSTTNTILGSGKYPTGWHAHEAGLRLNVTQLKDNLGYRSKQYTSELDNRLEFHRAGVRWRPRQMFKYTTSRRENPDGSSNELEAQNTLEGEVSKLKSIGQVKFKGEFVWRRRETGAGTVTKNKYVGELDVARKIMGGTKIGLNTVHERETFGGAVPTPGTDNGTGGGALEDQTRHSYRIDLQSSVSPRFSAGGNAMLITSNDTRIRRLTASVSVRVPKLNLPVQSSLVNEKRTLTGLPSQTLTQIETKSNYNFRRVKLIVSHTFVYDRQLTEKYRYQKLLAKLSRDFDVL
jgi:hypothetical protein